MSEYQYVEFRAVDRPLDDKQLEFAQKQSSRAEVSRWSLSVEYNYSSFGGDVEGLLRNGFDVFVQYSNYGDREIKLRLPHGMPFAKSVWSKYVDGEQLVWKSDAKGRGGILSLQPSHESDSVDEVWEFDECRDAAVAVRERLMSSDLRALYVLWLCAAYDDNNDPEEMIEPPVPHGIADAGTYAGDVLSFNGLDPLLLMAAGSEVGPAPKAESKKQSIDQWVESLDIQRTKELLQCLLVGDTASEKARLLAEIRDSQVSESWPTSDKRRTLDELLQKANVLRDEEAAKENRKAQVKAKQDAKKAERERADRIKQMRKDPEKWLQEAERIAGAGGVKNYQAAAEILYDLREAIGGSEGDKVARRQAAHLAQKHPTLNHLKNSLRKRGLY